MKKTTLFAPLALTLALGLMTGCTAAAMNSSSAAAASDVAPAGSPSSTVSAGIAGSAGSDEYIAQADAENIALTDAGLTADTVSGMHGRLDYDDGRAVYDIEFWTATAEYDYEIDAVSGEILSMDQDAENYTPAASQSGSASGEWIGEDAARQAALAHAGLADDSSVQFVHTELDRDDGRTVYEVEFWTGSRRGAALRLRRRVSPGFCRQRQHHLGRRRQGRRLCPRRRGRGRRYPAEDRSGRGRRPPGVRAGMACRRHRVRMHGGRLQRQHPPL